MGLVDEEREENRGQKDDYQGAAKDAKKLKKSLSRDKKDGDKGDSKDDGKENDNANKKNPEQKNGEKSSDGKQSSDGEKGAESGKSSSGENPAAKQGEGGNPTKQPSGNGLNTPNGATPPGARKPDDSSSPNFNNNSSSGEGASKTSGGKGGGNGGSGASSAGSQGGGPSAAGGASSGGSQVAGNAASQAGSQAASQGAASATGAAASTAAGSTATTAATTAASTAASSAATAIGAGAAAGSVGGPIGTAIGAGVGILFALRHTIAKIFISIAVIICIISVMITMLPQMLWNETVERFEKAIGATVTEAVTAVYDYKNAYNGYEGWSGVDEDVRAILAESLKSLMEDELDLITDTSEPWYDYYYHPYSAKNKNGHLWYDYKTDEDGDGIPETRKGFIFDGSTTYEPDKVYNEATVTEDDVCLLISVYQMYCLNRDYMCETKAKQKTADDANGTYYDPTSIDIHYNLSTFSEFVDIIEACSKKKDESGNEIIHTLFPIQWWKNTGTRVDPWVQTNTSGKIVDNNYAEDYKNNPLVCYNYVQYVDGAGENETVKQDGSLWTTNLDTFPSFGTSIDTSDSRNKIAYSVKYECNLVENTDFTNYLKGLGVNSLTVNKYKYVKTVFDDNVKIIYTDKHSLLSEVTSGGSVNGNGLLAVLKKSTEVLKSGGKYSWTCGCGYINVIHSGEDGLTCTRCGRLIPDESQNTYYYNPVSKKYVHLEYNVYEWEITPFVIGSIYTFMGNGYSNPTRTKVQYRYSVISDMDMNSVIDMFNEYAKKVKVAGYEGDTFIDVNDYFYGSEATTTGQAITEYYNIMLSEFYDAGILSSWIEANPSNYTASILTCPVYRYQKLEAEKFLGFTTKTYWVDIDGNIKITSPYGTRESPTAGASTNHGGIDIVCLDTNGNNVVNLGEDYKVPVYAAANGVVSEAGEDGGYGNCVKLIHADIHLGTVYGHLSSITVSPGQSVVKGETIIGYMGSTGVSTGPHLHWEVRKLNADNTLSSTKVNPTSYLKLTSPGT